MIHPHIFLGGAEKQLLYLAYYLKKMGCVVDIICLTAQLQGFTTKIVKDVSIITPCIESKLKKKIFVKASLMRTRQRMKLKEVASMQTFELFELRKMVNSLSEDYDILNPHNFPAHWASIKPNKIIVWTCNDLLFARIEEWKGEHLTKCLARTLVELDKLLVKHFISKIIVTDDYSALQVKHRYGMKPFIIHPAIDFEFFSKGDPSRIRRKYDLENSFVILHVGALTPQKNQMCSILAMKKILKHIPNAKLVLVGEGSDKLKLMKAAEQTGVLDHVLFTGWIDDEDLRDMYHACDVCINPALEKSWWIASLEALCAEKVSIVPRQSGLGILFERKRIGLTITPSPEELADIVIKVKNHRKEFNEIAIRGKDFVRKHLTYENYAKKFLEAVHSIKNA